MPRRRSWRGHRAEWDQHVAGVSATFDGTCPVCQDNITVRVHRVVKTRRGWVHIQCHSGWSD